jgi:hypothetical protein
MMQILSTLMPEQANKFRKIAHSDGLPLTAEWIKQSILSQEVE